MRYFDRGESMRWFYAGRPVGVEMENKGLRETEIESLHWRLRRRPKVDEERGIQGVDIIISRVRNRRQS